MVVPTEYRLGQVQRALWMGATIEQVYDATKIDKWYLEQIQLINGLAKEIREAGDLSLDLLQRAKSLGFSDVQIATLRGTSESKVREERHLQGVRPVYKTVDTCAAEFEAHTPYHYSSYELESEVSTAH
jgi:carbamoyl-phosphate synthase large subunit